MVSRSTPTEIRSVPGLPRTARIYRIGASANWQFRYFVDGNPVRLSTGEAKRKAAEEKSRQLFRTILLRGHADENVHRNKFAAVVRQYLKRQQALVDAHRATERTYKEELLKFQKDLLPYFGAMDVDAITFSKIEDYLETLTPRNLSKSTLKKHELTLRKALTFAADEGLLKSAPRFPRMATENNARPYFDLESYTDLWQAAYTYALEKRVVNYFVKGRSVRKLRFTDDFAHFIVFHVNSFVRPSDYKELQHKHVKIDERDGSKFLEIFPPHSKTSDRSSVTNERAVTVYEALLATHRLRGFGKPEDYVFYPEHRNRTYVLDMIRRLFRQILKDLNIERDQRGRERTLYSLRHTALMLRYLYGGPITNIIDFARNALTSVAMLEKFYLSHAENKLKVKELQAHGLVLYHLTEADFAAKRQEIELYAKLDQILADRS